MSIWASLDLPEPIRDAMGGSDIDVSTTDRYPEHGEAVRIYQDDLGHDNCIEVTVADAVRLRDALDRAIRRLHPAGPPPPPDRV